MTHFHQKKGAELTQKGADLTQKDADLTQKGADLTLFQQGKKGAVFWAFQGGKIHFLQKVLKKWSSI